MGKLLNNYLTVFIFIIIIIMFHASCSSLPGNSTLKCKPSERAALLNFKHSLTHFDESVSSSWVGEECCTWQGVSCDDTTGHVFDLNLSGNDNMLEMENTESLVYLLQLKHLEHLDLSMNNLSNDSIPSFLGNLSTLKTLDLSSNMFSGQIPTSLANLSNLERLDLSYNKLSSISSSFMFPPNLKYLGLNNNQLSGQIPISIGQLTELQTLDILSNLMEGTVLTELHFANLSSLTDLYMSDTFLTLNISSDWVAPFQLKYLFATNCKINGELPPWLHTQNNLTFLSLSSANISGLMPKWFHTMQGLAQVILSNNKLSGSPIFPINFLEIDLSGNSLSGEYLSNDSHKQVYRYADSVDLSNNQINGPIPKNIGHIMPSLASLDLSNNQINSTIPKYIGHIMTSLQHLYLSNNLLSGTIPKSLCLLTSLETLAIENNSLSGVIPNCLANTSGLFLISLSYNKLQGHIPCFNTSSRFYMHLNDNMLSGEIPSCLSDLTNLEVLDVGGNQLSGKIPRWFTAEKYGALRILRLRGNKFSGIIPRQICSLSQLQLLDLGHNRFTGSIPPCLNNLTSMKSLDVADPSQDFRGPIPKNIDHIMPNLQFLDLSNNLLSGPIPKNIDHIMPNLQFLHLFNNQINGTIPKSLCLTGSIPPCLSNLTAMTSLDVNASNGFDSFVEDVNVVIQGIERAYTSTLRYLVDIDFSCNYFVGSIPEDITNLSSLLSLNLSNNQLSGTIPQNIGGLKSLIALDLSNNKLKGVIPTSMAELYHLSYLNLSYNNLSGAIPTGNQLQTLSDPASSYAGNPYLCGNSLLKKCNGQINKQGNGKRDEGNGEDDEKREKMWFVLVVMSGVATGFWGVVGSLVLKRSWRHAFSRRAEGAYDWVYVMVAVRMAKINNK